MEDQVAEVKSKVDIVEVISSYIPLKKTGRNFAALCPFHSEKTPSLMISPDRQVFKCFGCGEAGDVFTFLEKMEGWDFREVLEELAKRVGVKLKSFVPSDKSQEREKLISINSLTGKFYAHLLNEHPIGKKAREYLESRGIKKSLWLKFGLGFAPDSWETVSQFLAKRGYSLADIAMAGLVVSRQGDGRAKDRQGFYDRFRNRLIFPLKDNRGTTLGFSARLLGESKEAKYINSPETPIFNKGSLLFGMDIARSAIREKNQALLVEGEFDVLSSHQIGIENVVASKGTALTERQAALLSRTCENVALCFDTDLAGDAAAHRGIELLDLAGVSVKVVRLGKFGPSSTASSDSAYLSGAKYKDPDEFSQKDPAGFKKAIAGAENIYDYFIESALLRHSSTTADGQKKIGREILPVLAKISDDIVRAHYIEKLAKSLDLNVNLVAQAVEKKVTEIYPQEPSSLSQNIKSTIGLEEYFLALFISYDDLKSWPDLKVLPLDFENEAAGRFWKWLSAIIKFARRRQKSQNFAKLSKKLPKELTGFVDNLYLINISPAFGEKEAWGEELIKLAKRIKQRSLKRQLSLISQKLKLAQTKKDNRQVAILTKNFDKLARNLERDL